MCEDGLHFVWGKLGSLLQNASDRRGSDTVPMLRFYSSGCYSAMVYTSACITMHHHASLCC